MKKLILAAIAAASLAIALPSAAIAGEGRGGCMGGLIGCCFGLRTAADYNEGMEVSLREWLRCAPFVGFFVCIMDIFDGYNGVTRSELSARQPTYY